MLNISVNLLIVYKIQEKATYNFERRIDADTVVCINTAFILVYGFKQDKTLSCLPKHSGWMRGILHSCAVTFFYFAKSPWLCGSYSFDGQKSNQKRPFKGSAAPLKIPQSRSFSGIGQFLRRDDGKAPAIAQFRGTTLHSASSHIRSVAVSFIFHPCAVLV